MPMLVLGGRQDGKVSKKVKEPEEYNLKGERVDELMRPKMTNIPDDFI